MSRSSDRAGLVYAGLCALNGAFVPAVAKLTTDRAAPLFVAMTTCLVAGVAGLVALSLRREVGRIVERGNRARLFVTGALGTGLAFFLFFEGARRSSAIDTVLCLQIEPAYSLIAARVFLGHPMTRRRIGAVGLLLAGIALAIGAEGFTGSAGAWLLLATPLCWQASHLIVLRGGAVVEPHVLTGARYVYGGLLLAAFWLARDGLAALPEPELLASLAPVLVLQGVLQSYLGTFLWYQAIARLDLARSTAIVVPSIPLLSLVASFLLLGEVASARQWLGLALTAAGVVSFVSAPPSEGAAAAPATRSRVAASAQDA